MFGVFNAHPTKSHNLQLKCSELPIAFLLPLTTLLFFIIIFYLSNTIILQVIKMWDM